MDKKHMLKILVLTDFFFPDSVGGANKMSFYTAQGLVNKGHRVSVITRRVRPELADRETIKGIEVYRYDLPRKSYLSFKISACPQIRNILSLLEKEGFSPLDLVILHQPLIALEAAAASFVKEAPWIYNFHSPWGEEFMISRSGKGNGGWNPQVFIHKKIKDYIEGRVLRRSQKVIVLSEFMQKRLERVHGMMEKSVIIPGGVDTEVFSPPENQALIRQKMGLPMDKIILFSVRNLRQRMGLSNLIYAMADLGDIKENIHLVIAGKGELEEKLKQLAAEQKIADRITFPGYVSEKELPKWYKAADVFVLPTEYLEGFGMVTLEAMATGLPIIATPVGATPEILSRIGSEWLCENASSGALASKVKDRAGWLIRHPHEYEALRSHCRQVAVKNYAWSGIMDQWEMHSQEVIQAWQQEA